MYISSCSIRSWNWNRKLTQDHFLIEHWIQRTHRCPAARCWPWVYSLGMVSRYSTVRSGTLTWREWGLWWKHCDPKIRSALRWPLRVSGKVPWIQPQATASVSSGKNGYKSLKKLVATIQIWLTIASQKFSFCVLKIPVHMCVCMISLLEIHFQRPWFESCIQQRKTTCLFSIRKSLARARASKLTTRNMYITRARYKSQPAVGSSGLNAHRDGLLSSSF